MSRPDEAPASPFSTRAGTGEVLPVGGGYRLLKRLGQGAFGEVWRAEAPGGVEVAVKIISRTVKPEEARRELEALEVIKRLRHHFLLSLQAFFPLPDRLIIVLELADTSLRALLRACQEGQGLPPADLLRYTLEAAEALDYLHEQKVHHRDIKPDNLLLLGNHIKVADFGLARVLETVLLQSASQAGTPAYMAPEVWSGKLSPHSDQYSLALSFAELRLGRFPLAYDNLANLMLAHLQGQADLDPLPEPEQAVLRRALAKEPGERYPSCTAFVQALIAAYQAAQRRPGGNRKGLRSADMRIISEKLREANRSSSVNHLNSGPQRDSHVSPPAVEEGVKVPRTSYTGSVWLSPRSCCLYYVLLVAVLGIGMMTLAFAARSSDLQVVFGWVAGLSFVLFSGLCWYVWKRMFSPQELVRRAGTGNDTAVRALIESGVPIDGRNTDGDTALLRAVECGHAGIVRMLLLHGADPTLEDGFGRSALDIALTKGHGDIAVLIERAAGGNSPQSGLRSSEELPPI
jgi:serine/threonine protein kinase